MRKSIWLPILVALTTACSPSPPDLSVSDAWARASTARDGPGAVYLTIRNRGGEDRLTKAATPRAMAATLHSTSIEDGIVRMRPLQDGLAVPAYATLSLQPNGPHIMLTRAGPLTPGERFPMTLVFERSESLTVQVEVKPAMEGHAGHDGEMP